MEPEALPWGRWGRRSAPWRAIIGAWSWGHHRGSTNQREIPLVGIFFMFMSWRIRKYPKIIKMNGNYLLFVPWWIGKLDFLKRFQYQIQFANTWNYFHWTYHWNWNMVVSKIFPILLDFCWHVHILFSWLYSHYISWYSHSCWLKSHYLYIIIMYILCNYIIYIHSRYISHIFSQNFIQFSKRVENVTRPRRHRVTFFKEFDFGGIAALAQPFGNR